MALFVHEFIDFPNAKNVDNGWWEYDKELGRVYNSVGGGHNYTPHPLNVFIEGTWDTVMREDLLLHRNDYITGWIAPDGEFFGCSAMGHRDVAEYVFGKTERELEDSGYLKVYEIPACLRAEYSFKNQYGYYGRPTQAQELTLERLGIEI